MEEQGNIKETHEEEVPGNLNIAIEEIIRQRDNAQNEAKALRTILGAHNIRVGELHNYDDVVAKYTPPKITAPVGKPRTIQDNADVVYDQTTLEKMSANEINDNWEEIAKQLERNK